MKMLTFLCVAVMILACEADTGQADSILSCSADAWIRLMSGGSCTFSKRERCRPTNGDCGWGTQVMTYTCDDEDHSCKTCCWVPCGNEDDPRPCESNYKEDCKVKKMCPCSKTCGVGLYLVTYRDCPNEPHSITCLEECCCKPCEGRGIFKPAKPCRGDVVVEEKHRKDCCPFTPYEWTDPGTSAEAEADAEASGVAS